MQRRSRKSSYGGLKDSKSCRKITLEQIVEDSSFEWLPHEDTFDRLLNAEACLQVQSKDETKTLSLSESKDDTDIHSSSESKENVSGSSGIFHYADQENKGPVRSRKSAVHSKKKQVGSRKSAVSSVPSNRSRCRKSKAVSCAHTLLITPEPASKDDQASAEVTKSVNDQRGDSHVYSFPSSEVVQSSLALSANGAEDVPLSAVTVRPASTPFVVGAATRLFPSFESPVLRQSPTLERSLSSLERRSPALERRSPSLERRLPTLERSLGRSDALQPKWSNVEIGVDHLISPAAVESAKKCRVNSGPGEGTDNRCVFGIDDSVRAARDVEVEANELSFVSESPAEAKIDSSQRSSGVSNVKLELPDAAAVSEPDIVSCNYLSAVHGDGFKDKAYGHSVLESMVLNSDGVNGFVDYSHRETVPVSFNYLDSKAGKHGSNFSGHRGELSYYKIDFTDDTGVSPADSSAKVDNKNISAPTKMKSLKVSGSPECLADSIDNDGSLLNMDASVGVSLRSSSRDAILSEMGGVLANDSLVDQHGLVAYSTTGVVGVSEASCSDSAVDVATATVRTCRVCVSRLNCSRLQSSMNDGHIVSGIECITQLKRRGADSSKQVKKNSVASSTQVKKNSVASSTQVKKNGAASSTQVKKNGATSSTQVKKNCAESTQMERRGVESSTDVEEDDEESSLSVADSTVAPTQSLKQCRVRLSQMTESKLRSVLYPVNSHDESAVAAPHFGTLSCRCRLCYTDDYEVDAGNGSNRSTNSSVCSSYSSSPVQPVNFSCLLSCNHAELVASPPVADGWQSTEARSSSRQAVLDGSSDPGNPAEESSAGSAAGAASIQARNDSTFPRPETTGLYVSVDPCTPNARRTGRPDASLVRAIGGGTPLLATRRGKGWRRSLVICSPLVRPTDRRRSCVHASQLLPPQRSAAAALVSQPLLTGVVTSQRRLSAARPLQTPSDRAASGASRRQSRRYSLAIDGSGVAEGYNSACAPVRRSSFYVAAADPIIPDHVAPSDLSSPKTPSICRVRLPLGTPAAKAVPDAEAAVLRLCSDQQVISFTTFLRRARISRKVGEGVYGEVFLCDETRSKQMTVVKIMPIEGDRVVNGAAQKTYGEVLSEIVISKNLSDLRHDRSCRTSGFVELMSCHVVQGRYPHRLRQSWLRYHKEKGSENEDPRCFNPDQLFLVLEYAHAGTDLEGYTFDTPAQALSAFIQVAFSLAVAECALNFEHRDLHWGNVLLKQDVASSDRDDGDSQRVICELAGRRLSVSSCGVRATLIDFTLSRMSSPADGDDAARVIFNNLEEDEELFNSYGDYQFDIYRNMRQVTGGQWWLYRPYTNVQWLHYLLDKMCVDVKYGSAGGARDHRRQMRRLSLLRDSLLQAESATQLLLQRFNQFSEELVALTTSS